jgi:NAD(P)-dependent dehydrogenase (short-subunit alcohol dehydrogenase family)
MSLTADRVAIVTGAGRGIGQVVAQRLAQLGWDVGLTARSADELEVTAELVRSAGARELTMAGDVSKPGDVERFCAAVEQGLGQPRLLVNNAAIAGEYGGVVGSDPDLWWQVQEVNVRGPYLMCRRLAPAMIEHAAGYIININSLDCARASAGGSPAYSVSKTALRRLTEALAVDLEATGVVVFDLSPGLVRTAMGGSRPDAAQIAPEVWMPPSAAADKIEALVSGRYDALCGRFLHAKDDLDALLITVPGVADARMLRLLPADSTDTLFAYGALAGHRPAR